MCVRLTNDEIAVERVELAALIAGDDTRRGFELMALAFSRQEDFNRRMDVRQKQLEGAMAAVSAKTDRSADEVAQLRARLEALEAKSV